MQLKNLDYTSFEQIFADIIDGKIDKISAKKILLEINDIGFQTATFLGAMHVLKKRMKKINAPKNAIDVCGTGGDCLNTLNISTAVCFVVAACGIIVAKHGNKAISSKSGSADIFKELGVEILSDVLAIEKNLREKKLCFLFAPFFHESLKNLVEIRKEIADEFNVPTIFNYLGPLLNPANVKKQFIGTSKKETMLPMLEALKINGSEAVYIVHGFDKMDEITLCDNSYFLKFENNKISEEEIINPQDFGFKKIALDELKGGDAKYNAQKLIDLLACKKSAYRDIVLLNSAFALKLSGVAKDVNSALNMACQAIDGGKARKILQDLVV
ncbi:MAG TPA: anthranilate phosphoribosyltransferase [Rickettsiales bacterium]|nr:anthranilate phosphoribosyltransferase [Rickettsiales bacterium]